MRAASILARGPLAGSSDGRSSILFPLNGLLATLPLFDYGRVARDPGGIGYAGRRYMFATAPLRQVRQAKLMLAEGCAESADEREQFPKSRVKIFDMRLHRTAVLTILLHLATALPALAEQRMVSVGERRIAVYCDGELARFPTVILVPAGGRTAKDWDTVQTEVARFTRVCSYDHANFGQSDRAPVRLQTVDEVVDDLHAWLQASREKGPFVLVSHSNSGIHVRRFETRYAGEVAGLVFLDSAHEEQALRLHELDPAGPAPDELMARVGWYVKPGQRLDWQTKVPLIVIGRGTPFERTARDGSNSQNNRMTEEQFAAWDRIWTEFQKDLAKRSPRGEYRLAQKSGHWIQRDQPELVVQAIRDVCRMAGTR